MRHNRQAKWHSAGVLHRQLLHLVHRVARLKRGDLGLECCDLSSQIRGSWLGRFLGLSKRQGERLLQGASSKDPRSAMRLASTKEASRAAIQSGSSCVSKEASRAAISKEACRAAIHSGSSRVSWWKGRPGNAAPWVGERTETSCAPSGEHTANANGNADADVCIAARLSVRASSKLGCTSSEGESTTTPAAPSFC